MNNFWGEPDDEPLPTWMDPKTYQKGNQLKKSRQSLEEACAIALTKPAIPVTLQEYYFLKLDEKEKQNGGEQQ